MGNALISLREYAGWSASLLSTRNKIKFSRDHVQALSDKMYHISRLVVYHGPSAKKCVSPRSGLINFQNFEFSSNFFFLTIVFNVGVYHVDTIL